MTTLGLKMNLNLIIIYLMIWFTVCIKVTEQGAQEEKLLDELFNQRGYQPLARPVEYEHQAVDVQFSISLTQIIDVDEKNEMFHSNLWLSYTWTDYKLKWNASDYGGVSAIVIPPSMVWTPDILLYNSADEDIDSKFPSNVIVNSDGTCSWIPPGIFISTCPIDIKWFPFDDQVCKLKFGSWSYDGLKINLTFHDQPVNLRDYVPNGEWNLLGVHAKRNVKKYVCCEEPYIDLTFYVHIQRRSLYYDFNLVMPCGLISALILLTFIVPSGEGEKIGLGITILLALSVFQLIVADIVPATSLAVPLIGVYFTGAMTMCTISIIMTVLVLNLHHRTPDIYVMPSWIKRGVCVWLAGLLRMSRPGTENEVKVKVTSLYNSLKGKSKKSADQNIESRDQQTNRKFDNMAAAQACHIYQNTRAREGGTGREGAHLLPPSTCPHSHVYVTYNGDEQNLHSGTETHILNPTRPSVDPPGYRQATIDSTESNDSRLCDGLSSQEPEIRYPNDAGLITRCSETRCERADSIELGCVRELRDILKEMKYITESMRDESDQKNETNDWMFAANVIDRLCLFIFSAFLVVLTIAVFSAAPVPRTIEEHLASIQELESN